MFSSKEKNAGLGCNEADEKMFFQSFDEVLEAEFTKEHPEVLDDDIEDRFNSWVEGLDIEHITKIINKYAPFKKM